MMKRKRLKTSCSICLDFISSQDGFQTECNHIFHHSCMVLYVSKSVKYLCPICRQRIIFDKKNNDLISFIRKYSLFNTDFNELIYYCIAKNNKNCLQFVLNHRGKFMFENIGLDCTFHNGFTALSLCIKKNRPILFKMLLKHGADVNAKDRSGKTAFMYSCEYSNHNMLQALIRNVKASNGNLIPIIQQQDIKYFDCIIYTIIGGNVPIFKVICGLFDSDLTYHILRKRYTEKGLTPLAYAISYKEYPMFLKLHSMNVSLSNLDFENNNALHYAAMYNNLIVFEKLYQSNAGLCVEKNKIGQLPIHLATKFGNVEIIKFILNLGPNSIELLSIKDSNGHNVLDLAYKWHMHDIITLLLHGGYLKKKELKKLTNRIIVI